MDDRTMARFLSAAAAGDPYAQQKVQEMRQNIALAQQGHPSSFAIPQPGDGGPSPIPASQVHPPAPGQFVHPVLAPSRVMIMDPIPLVPQGATSEAVRLQFDAGAGWIIGFRGSVVDRTPGAEAAGNLEMASIGLRMFLNDGEELITDGVRAAHATYADLFPPAAIWSPILRWVYSTDDLFALFRNLNPTEGGPDLQPSLTFLFWREKYPGT